MEQAKKLSVCCGCTLVAEAHYEPENDSSVTVAVTEALANAMGVEPVDIPPLYDYVDPDALNALAERTDDDIILGFQVETWNVFVRSDGGIRVCDATRPTDPEPVFGSTVA